MSVFVQGCGVTPSSSVSAIFLGRPAYHADWPWMVS